MTRSKTMFRIAIQQFVDGRPKRFANITVKEGASVDSITDAFTKKLFSLLFKESEEHIKEEPKCAE